MCNTVFFTMNMNPYCNMLRVMILNLFSTSVLSMLLSEDPFIFNPFTLKTYDLESIEFSPYNGLFAVACPAETTPQKKFEKKNSLDQKALFVGHLLKKDDISLPNIKCNRPYRMAVVYHKHELYGRLLEFGYEVYYDNLQKFQTGFTEHWFSSYFGEAEEVNSKLRRGFKLFRKDFLPDLAMKFVWVPKVEFKYIRSEWNVQWVWYSMTFKIGQMQLKATCENNDLGLRLYGLSKKQNFDDFYSPKNQKDIFGQLQLPNSADDVCKLQFKCVEEYNLVAPYRFQTSTSESIECSHLTSIPIWHQEIKILLDFTEKFIIALSQTVGNKIEVLTGVYQVLSFPQKNRTKPKLLPIHLNSKKGRLSVPKIVYKVVTSTANDCNTDTPFLECQFNIAIIIQNGPTTQERLCQDKCKELGWESIQYSSTIDTKENEKSQFIYCCEVDVNLKEKLLPDNRKLQVEKGVLNLKSYQHYISLKKNDEPKRISPNVQSEVENKMNELLGQKLDSVPSSLRVTLRDALRGENDS